MRNILPTEDGGYLMMAETYNADSNFTVHHGAWESQDIGLLKIDSNGNKIWSRVFGGSDDDKPCSIVKGPDTGCYVIATTHSNDLMVLETMEIMIY